MNRDKTTVIHIILLLLIIIFFIWSIIKPINYSVWSMEVLPAVVVLIITIKAYHKFRLTTLSYVIITILMILMFIGGHYSYSKVPLFDWIKDYFDLKRNHYDRLGHFLKGLIAIVFREILLRTTSLTMGKWLVLITFCITLSLGALYEIIEWAGTKIFGGGKPSKEFLGTQGDIWDSQWDMSLLVIGTLLALMIFSKYHTKQLKPFLNWKKEKK
ncbi:MAG TPA: DUF2238 domain-containing protein [Pseudoneobacillus sp.]|nr:DUF2238 domain-containing protein [Pseudoneobacillus sp.]